MRFDFNFPRKLETREIQEIEDWVNDKINAKCDIKRQELSLSEAEKQGAQAEFGTKYPEIVSVYTALDKKGKIITDGEISTRIEKIFDMRPGAIIQRFGLKNPIFSVTASYGHFGRDVFKKKMSVCANGKMVVKEIEFFGWEKLDYVNKVKKEFGIK